MNVFIPEMHVPVIIIFHRFRSKYRRQQLQMVGISRLVLQTKHLSHISYFMFSYNLNYNFRPLRVPSIILIIIQHIRAIYTGENKMRLK